MKIAKLFNRHWNMHDVNSVYKKLRLKYKAVMDTFILRLLISKSDLRYQITNL